eukprot:TRINITY_DN4579_c2_g1_i1.p1 TRINITY_DN4579_c2_g1~~TRINITY_DN4579_c2_g1_i1.p1  ORF type:complete len:581 (+),score=40.31 TRINITY_DN4579_c2_g1_i1:80-1822(+)
MALLHMPTEPDLPPSRQPPREVHRALAGLIEADVQLHFAQRCVRFSSRGSELDRAVAVTRELLLLCTLTGGARRSVRLTSVTKLFVDGCHVGIEIRSHPPDIWLHMRCVEDANELCEVVSALHSAGGQRLPAPDRSPTQNWPLVLDKPPGYRVHLHPVLIHDSVLERPQRHHAAASSPTHAVETPTVVEIISRESVRPVPELSLPGASVLSASGRKDKRVTIQPPPGVEALEPASSGVAVPDAASAPKPPLRQKRLDAAASAAAEEEEEAERGSDADSDVEVTSPPSPAGGVREDVQMHGGAERARMQRIETALDAAFADAPAESGPVVPPALPLPEITTPQSRVQPPARVRLPPAAEISTPPVPCSPPAMPPPAPDSIPRPGPCLSPARAKPNADSLCAVPVPSSNGIFSTVSVPRSCEADVRGLADLMRQTRATITESSRMQHSPPPIYRTPYAPCSSGGSESMSANGHHRTPLLPPHLSPSAPRVHTVGGPSPSPQVDALNVSPNDILQRVDAAQQRHVLRQTTDPTAFKLQAGDNRYDPADLERGLRTLAGRLQRAEGDLSRVRNALYEETGGVLR